jgi:hypothetical protein
VTAWTWTPARIAQLEQAVAEGLSAVDAARRMGAPTKNTVANKASRLGLKFRGGDNQVIAQRLEARTRGRMAPAKPGPAPKPTAQVNGVVEMKPVPMPKLRVVQTPGRFLPVADIGQNMCRYIEGDFPGRMDQAPMCAADTGGETYCPAHKALCFNGTKPLPKVYTGAALRWSGGRRLVAGGGVAE